MCAKQKEKCVPVSSIAYPKMSANIGPDMLRSRCNTATKRNNSAINVYPVYARAGKEERRIFERRAFIRTRMERGDCLEKLNLVILRCWRSIFENHERSRALARNRRHDPEPRLKSQELDGVKEGLQKPSLARR